MNKNKKSVRILCKLIVVLMSFAILPCFSLPAFAESRAQGPKNIKEINNFFYIFFSQYMKKDNVPGAAIVLVKDGKIIFKKGYGYSNIKTKALVNPDATIFENGSVGKLFTATAVMQLYEKGLIKLNDNVNDYLESFKIHNSFSSPVTFKNLLTHTSGLDEGSEVGGASKSLKDIGTYEEYMKNHITKVIEEPGITARYSNIGFNLLGYLVEKVSGTKYQDYIKENIFKPLQMRNSSVGIPINNMATGYYDDINGELKSTNYYSYTAALGAGTINSTAVDMAKFMIAQLQNGSYKDNKILEKSTAKLMQKQHFTNAAGLPGMGYCFFHSYKNNLDIIKHEGGMPDGFTSSLFLMPKQKLGFFVICNKLGSLPFDLEDKFINHYYPMKKSKPSRISSASIENAQDYEGTYRSYDGFSKTSITKMSALFSEDQEMNIKADKNGTLVMKGFNIAKEPIHTKLVQINPLLFRRTDDNSYIAFRKDKSGNITYLFNDVPHDAFEKLKWYETAEFNFMLFGFCVITFIVSTLVWGIRFIVRKIKGKTENSSKWEKIAKIYASLVCILNSVCIIGVLAYAMFLGYDIGFGIPAGLYLLLIGLMIGAVLTIGLIFFTFISWKYKYWNIARRLHYTILTISAVSFIWFINFWNILGLKF